MRRRGLQAAAPPDIECLAQLVAGIRGGRSSSLCDELLEANDVELIRLNPEAISGRARLDAIRTKRLAQLRHVHLQRGLSRCRRRLTPQLVDQSVTRHHLIRVQGQDRKHGALSRPADVKRAAVLHNLQRTENPELHLAGRLL